MPKTLPTPAAPGEKSRSYEPALDVIRFFAFFAVFFTHFINRGGNAIQVDAGQWWNTDFIQRIAAFGGQGVTLFLVSQVFCLAGYSLKNFK